MERIPEDRKVDRLKKTLFALAGALLLLAAVLLWRLDIPHWQKLDLSLLTRADTASKVYDASGAPAGTLDGSEPAQWTPISQVPEYVQNAFIAAEDLRFYRHHGVDVYRMLGALWQDIRTLSYAQGASTITQQLVKLTHLTQAKTLSRKAQEIVLALKLEKRMGKREILEAYLNNVYFGHGAYGIRAAAQTYFDKPVDELTLSEGALLAGIIKAPSTYAPHLNLEKSVARRNGILAVMADNGLITQTQEAEARAEGVQLASTAEDAPRYAWYMDSVLSEAQQALGWTAEEVLTGGLRIYTGLNPALQQDAQELFEDPASFPADASDGTPVQAALAALDTATGELRAVVGGRSYDVRRGLNRATQMARQPGSAFKPVSTYAAAVDAYGYVPSSIIDDTPRSFEGGYAPGNAGGNSYGLVTLREALSRSLNIATVDLAETVGVDAIRSYAGRFGIDLSDRDASLSLALGSLTDGVSPARLGAAYCALANGGVRVQPHAIRRIEDAAGRVLYQVRQALPRAVDSSSAYLITDMLRTAASTGSARALAACAFPVAGKTGTVSEPAGGTRDVWTVAYTPEIAVSAWMGFDQPDGQHALASGEGGGGYPARLCAAFLKAGSGELSRGDFPRPDAVKAVLLDAVALKENHVSLLSTEKTPADYTVRELFRAGNTPRRFSTAWQTPAAISDFTLASKPGETPILTFTAADADTEYVLARTSGGATEEIAVLRGNAGERLRYEDKDHDLNQTASYALLPRNARLHEAGVLLAGPVPPAVEYVPGGLLNAIMGIGAAEATPVPMETEDIETQSLFD